MNVAELVEFLPLRRLNDSHGDSTAHDHAVEGFGCFAILESARGTLPWPRLRAFDKGALWPVCHYPIADGNRIDAFFHTNASDGDIDRVDKLRRCIIVEHNDGKPAADTGISAKDLHDRSRNR